MEIASLSLPLYSYPPYDLTIKMNKDRNMKTSLDTPEWFSGNHDKLLVLQ